MFLRSLIDRVGHASKGTADRVLVSRYHDRLIDSRYWDCATPSKSLAVLGVLVRSGAMINKLDKAASGALSAMGPSMTKNEQALLWRWSSLLRLKRTTDFCSNSSSQFDNSDMTRKDANEDVMMLYSLFIKDSQATYSSREMPVALSNDSVLELDAMSSLMLLEMSLSNVFQHNATWRNENITGAFLSRLRYHVMNSDMIGFRAVWWILDVLSDRESFLARRPVESGRLFRACIRRLHAILPELTAAECLLIFPSLKSFLYDKPFIICEDIVRRLMICELGELSEVPNSTIIHTLRCDSLAPCFRRRLHQLLCEDYRMGDLEKEDCLFLLSTITTTSTHTSIEGEEKNHEEENDFLFCESLFAQLYITAKTMNPMECVTALEYMESLVLSQYSVPASWDLSERLKKRFFLVMKQRWKQYNQTTVELKHELETVHRLEGLLRRCVLLPFLVEDSAVITEIVRKIVYRLENPTSEVVD